MLQNPIQGKRKPGTPRVLIIAPTREPVLDEADRMLDMGFIPDVRKIIHSTPHKDKRQTMLYSATLTAASTRLAASWTKDPLRVEIHRTGRAGAVGTAISFADEEDAFYLPGIEDLIERKIDCIQPKDEWLVLPEPPSREKNPRRSRSRKPRNRK